MNRGRESRSLYAWSTLSCILQTFPTPPNHWVIKHTATMDRMVSVSLPPYVVYTYATVNVPSIRALTRLHSLMKDSSNISSAWLDNLSIVVLRENVYSDIIEYTRVGELILCPETNLCDILFLKIEKKF